MFVCVWKDILEQDNLSADLQSCIQTAGRSEFGQCSVPSKQHILVWDFSKWKRWSKKDSFISLKWTKLTKVPQVWQLNCIFTQTNQQGAVAPDRQISSWYYLYCLAFQQTFWPKRMQSAISRTVIGHGSVPWDLPLNLYIQHCALHCT